MPTLVLRQIEAPAPGQTPRELVLSGMAAPVDKIKWGGEQRNQLEWIPGSGTASVRLDGPAELPVELTFDWRSRLLGPDDARLGDVTGSDSSLNADGLVRALDAMRCDRALVELSWRDRTIVGFIQAFEAEEARFSEYTATLTFQPVKAPDFDEPQAVAVQSPRALFETLVDDFEQGLVATEVAVTFARQRVDDAAQAVADARGTLSRLGGIADSVGLTLRESDATRRAVGETLSSLGANSTGMLGAVAAPYSDIAGSDEPVAQLRARAWRDETAHVARRLRRRSALERGRYRFESDVLGRHVAVEGETIWSVSWRWYGTTAGADLVARRNNLRSTTLRGGQRLTIPRRAAA